MINFRVVTENGIDYLQATARIPKREDEICQCISEMYEQGLLCFSFEVKYLPDDTHMGAGGATIIDLGPHNTLTGVAVVSKPAYAEAVALDLVAELKDGGESTTERGETMPNEEMNAELLNMDNVKRPDGSDDDSAPVITPKEPESNTNSTESGNTDSTESGNTNSTEPGSTDSTETDNTDPTEPDNTDPTEPGNDNANDSGNGDTAVGEDATAEVLMHQVITEQTYRKGCEAYNEPDTVLTEVRETMVETVEENVGIAEDAEPEEDPEKKEEPEEEDEKDRKIAELETRIAELEKIEAKYNEIMKAEAEKALAEKQNKAKIFAEKLGLDSAADEVAQAIAELDYEKIANMTMDMPQTAVAEQEEETEEVKPEVPAWYQMASYVDMDIKDDGEYGDMLKPVSK